MTEKQIKQLKEVMEADFSKDIQWLLDYRQRGEHWTFMRYLSVGGAAIALFSLLLGLAVYFIK